MRLAPLRRPGQPAPLSEAAADWALRQEAAPLPDREQQQFETWLAADPAHVDAYEAAVWALDAPVRHAAAPELMAMREAALAARGERPSRIALWSGMAALAASAVAAISFYVAQPQLFSSDRPPVASSDPAVNPNRTTYRTAIGERLAVNLPDGSVVTLDTNSQVRVAYSGTERGIHLIRGQALFEVASGRPLPFQVYAAGQRITAVGTVFNVRLDGNEVRVALVEGVVRVNAVRPRPAGGVQVSTPSPELVMRAGEVVSFGSRQPIRAAQADVAQVASWRGGELVFNDTRLADAVAEINRYTTRPIAIADRSVGNHRVTGVFRTNDPERFSRAMSEVFPIEVSHDADGSPVLRARD